MDSDDFAKMCLEEYKALRSESQRCAQIFSNTIWIGISGFIITIGVSASVLKEHAGFLPFALLLLSLQAFAASVMFLSELWKYVRIGVYIRDKIETHFLPQQAPINVSEAPMYWEHWLTDKHEKLSYLISLSMLQLPVLFIVYLLLLPVIDLLPMEPRVLNWSEQLRNGTLLWPIIFIAVVDILTVLYFVWKISTRQGLKITEHMREVQLPSSQVNHESHE